MSRKAEQWMSTWLCQWCGTKVKKLVSLLQHQKYWGSTSMTGSGEGDRERGRWEYQRALKRLGSCRLHCGSTTTIDLTTNLQVPQHPKKKTHTSHTLQPLLCVLPRSAARASSSRQEVHSEDRPTCADKGESTKSSYRETFWKTKERFLVVSLVSCMNKGRYKGLRILPQEKVRREEQVKAKRKKEKGKENPS